MCVCVCVCVHACACAFACVCVCVVHHLSVCACVHMRVSKLLASVLFTISAHTLYHGLGML